MTRAAAWRRSQREILSLHSDHKCIQQKDKNNHSRYPPAQTAHPTDVIARQLYVSGENAVKDCYQFSDRPVREEIIPENLGHAHKSNECIRTHGVHENPKVDMRCDRRGYLVCHSLYDAGSSL